MGQTLISQGVDGWAVDRLEGYLEDVFSADEVIYLSPDAEEEPKTSRTVKQCTLRRVQEQEMRYYKLPIPSTMTAHGEAKVLKVDNVARISGHILVEQDWMNACENVIPERILPHPDLQADGSDNNYPFTSGHALVLFQG